MRTGRFLAGTTLVIALSGVLAAQRPGTLSGSGAPTPSPQTGRQGPQSGRQRPPRDLGQAPQGTASITGRVVAAENGRPLQLAQVRLMGAGRPRIAVTDASGAYSFTDLPAATYRVN